MSDMDAEARDRGYMAQALELARRGLWTTHPNPRVGCVLALAGNLIAQGWHERAGGPHAEVVALSAARAAGVEVRGATAYTTLEPCSHHGRTPPCVDALIEAGVARVVVALEDPNPQVRGTGLARLRAAGIRVDCLAPGDPLAEQARALNAGFLKRMSQGLPWLRLKLAMSLDGRTALADGQSQWLTSEAARADVQRWRAQSAAVLTGIGTVLADDPRMSVRLPEATRQPLRVVLDGQLRTPSGARLFEGAQGVLIVTTELVTPTRGGGHGVSPATRTLEEALAQQSVLQARRAALEQSGIQVATVRGDAVGKLDLHAVMRLLGELQVNEVFVEAGARLAGALLRAGLVDELLLYVAPMLLGPQARPLVELPELAALAGAPRFALREAAPVGPDLRLRLQPETT